MAMWPTPDAMVAQDGEQPETWLKRRAELKAKHINGNGCGTPLAMAVKLSPSMSSLGGSRARTLAMPARELVWRGPGAVSGSSLHDWLASYDRGSWWQRMSWVFSPTELRKWSGRWPRQGMTRSGRLYGHRMLGRRTVGSGCSSSGTPWTTPCVRDKETLAKVTRGAGSKAAGQEMVEPLLVQAAKDWLMPQSRDHKGISQKVAKGLFTGGLPDQLAGLPAPARRNTSGSRPESSPAQDGGEWQTPKATNVSTPVTHHPERGDGGQPNLARQIQTGTAPVVLNHRWVSTLMGLLLDWCDISDESLVGMMLKPKHGGDGTESASSHGSVETPSRRSGTR